LGFGIQQGENHGSESTEAEAEHPIDGIDREVHVKSGLSDSTMQSPSENLEVQNVLTHTSVVEISHVDNEDGDTSIAIIGDSTSIQGENLDEFAKKHAQKLKVPNLKHIFTISCNMPAEDFFKLMALHDNPFLIDTRRSRSYRNSRFSDEKDIGYLCEMHDVAYEHLLDLAPTRELRAEFHRVFDSKDTSKEERAYAWTNFLKQYTQMIVSNKVLREGSPLRWIVEGKHESIVIMCACKHHEDCHRQATAGFLEKWIEGVEVHHISPVEIDKPKAKWAAGPRRYLVEDIPQANLVARLPRGWRK